MVNKSMIILIKKYLRKHFSRRARNILKGFRHLKTENNLGMMRIIRHEFASTPLNIIEQRFRPLIFGSGLSQAEIIIRQYLLAVVATMNFDKAFLPIVGKPHLTMIYYLPPQWREVVRKKGVQVAELRSAIAWNFFLMLEFLKGIATICQMIWFSCKTKNHKQLGRYVYFDKLTNANLPKSSNHPVSYDIITWYAQWEGRCEKFDCFSHNVEESIPTEVNRIPVIPIRSAILALKNFMSLFCFVAWCIASFWVTLFDCFRGRWWHALLFREAVKSKVIQLQNAESLATEYLFHEFIYRPLWTYEAEKKGSKLSFYFYSLATEPFKCFPQFKDLPTDYVFEAMNWPRYLVWDNEQAEDMTKIKYEKKIEIVGPIWFVDSVKTLPTIPQRTIAVFDNPAFRESIFSLLPVDLIYYSPDTVNQFINDICHAALENNIHIAFKQKRDIGNWIHPKYQMQLNQLSSWPQWIQTESDISPNRLISACIAAISIPFTTTAVIANRMGKCSIYYDALGIVQKNERQAHGIPVIACKDELAAWMHTVVNASHEKKMLA